MAAEETVLLLGHGRGLLDDLFLGFPVGEERHRGMMGLFIRGRKDTCVIYMYIVVDMCDSS